jgi:hypothetical protein
MVLPQWRFFLVMASTDQPVIDENYQVRDMPTWQCGANFPQATTQRPADGQIGMPIGQPTCTVAGSEPIARLSAQRKASHETR